MALYSTIFRKLLMPTYQIIKSRKLLQYKYQYENHLKWSDEQLKKYQWQKLSKLIHHAYNTTSYYKRVWAEIGITSPNDITSIEDFYKLPLITKDDIREHYDEFISTKFTNNIKKSTGGSTGQPFHFELDNFSNEARQAVMWRGYGWCGYKLGNKALFLWSVDIGNQSFKQKLKNNLYHAFYNRTMLNLFELKQSNIKKYIKKINNSKPQNIVSYVNPIYEVAKYINANNINATSPISIITGAEPLFDYQREEIEKAFNTKVYDTFGCREFMLIAAECEKKQGLHINVDHLVVETIDGEGSQLKGSSGDLVITDLSNFGMPLIRYVNGDKATISRRACSCGNPLPLMENIDGRKPDVIHTPSGGIINGVFFPHMFKEFIQIKKFQVKQVKVNELIITLIVDDDYSTAIEDLVSIEINKYTNNEIHLIFNYVNEIPLTLSGKHRFIISEI